MARLLLRVRKLRIRRFSRRWLVLLIPLALVLAAAMLFAFNGLLLARNETPEIGFSEHAAAPPLKGSGELKIVAFNIAKGFVHRGGARFDSRENVEARVARISDLLNAEKPDLVFLSEAVFECTPCPVNQIVEIAESTGMHCWAFGENYNFGLPFFRIVGGNAILSRWPLEAVGNPSLIGRKPFYKTANSRRALFCSLHIAGTEVLLGSLHNDSFNLENNDRQLAQVLEYIGQRPAVLAGDFNAWPGSPPITRLSESNRFVGATEGLRTFPSTAPQNQIDFVFGPKRWELLECHTIESDVSDHLAVVSTFRVNSRENREP
jgi:endonuclease/exonuclease/phosphatase family metal-dependent hydrolase